MGPIHVASGDDEALERDEWIYKIAHDSSGITVSLVKFLRWERHSVYAPWQETNQVYYWPDMFGKSTIEKPAVPEWVEREVIQRILLTIRFNNE